MDGCGIIIGVLLLRLLFREGLFGEDNKTEAEGETDNVEEEFKEPVDVGSGGLFCFGVL